MKTITLLRISKSTKCTMGVFIDNTTGLPFCISIELPWLDNQVGISCIPTGAYIGGVYSSVEYPDVYQVKNVPKRSSILVRIGNTISDTTGSILPGMYYGEENNLPAACSSTYALDKIRALIGASDFNLIIM